MPNCLSSSPRQGLQVDQSFTKEIGSCEFREIQSFLHQVAHKLPFPAKAMSRETLEKMRKDQEDNNQNPGTFECIATANMLGIRKVLSPYDLTQKGQYWGKFYLPEHV
ncbi:39S ribosomal protein L16, mitochondrial [Myotis davidii]|uniref:39S ribosomal protein L16, mitochondrial n=1 Tax=Myotis davidii TaxID=225400 RepID=L5LBI8_MYODS|nr:39S ribosomal protein L16, mitochondrial [Myotis davidii]